MSKKNIVFYPISLLLATCFFIGCVSEQPSISDDKAYIVLTDCAGVSFEKNTFSVERGGDIQINISIEEGYIWEGCSYNGEYSIKNNEDSVTITLLDVKYDGRISFSVNRISGKIFYYLNGGAFVDETNQSDFFMENAVGKYRDRVNTNIGDEIYRDGYTQLGWNTAPDGSGERYGLGSRITVNEGESVVLYAEWAQWTPISFFTYGTNHETLETGDIVIKKFTGSNEIDTLVIPAEIEGKRVSCIGEDFSEGLKLKTLVLPKTMETVKIGSFAKSSIDEIYLFDGITTISDGCFDGSIKNVNINAVWEPRYVSNSNMIVFCEVMDRIILNADKKKMIFYAGCSMNYGLNSKTVSDAFNNEYVICDIGVIGSCNATFQIECILNYLNKDDIFIHAPEEMSYYQLLEKLNGEERMFICAEGNYDLFRLVDCSLIPGFFDSFAIYNKTRKQLPSCSYSDYNFRYNEYGDDTTVRPNSEEDAFFGLEVPFNLKYLTDKAFINLNSYYNRIEDKGAEVLFSFAPINKNSLTTAENESKVWLTFENKVRENLDARFSVISCAEDYIMSGKYFYDTDYHLTNEGADIRTQMLIRDLKKALES